MLYGSSITKSGKKTSAKSASLERILVVALSNYNTAILAAFDKSIFVVFNAAICTLKVSEFSSSCVLTNSLLSIDFILRVVNKASATI